MGVAAAGHRFNGCQEQRVLSFSSSARQAFPDLYMLSGRLVKGKEPDTGSSRIHGMDFTWESLVIPHQQRTVLALLESRNLLHGTSSLIELKVRVVSLIGESSRFGNMS